MSAKKETQNNLAVQSCNQPHCAFEAHHLLLMNDNYDGERNDLGKTNQYGYISRFRNICCWNSVVETL